MGSRHQRRSVAHLLGSSEGPPLSGGPSRWRALDRDAASRCRTARRPCRRLRSRGPSTPLHERHTAPLTPRSPTALASPMQCEALGGRWVVGRAVAGHWSPSSMIRSRHSAPTPPRRLSTREASSVRAARGVRGGAEWRGGRRRSRGSELPSARRAGRRSGRGSRRGCRRPPSQRATVSRRTSNTSASSDCVSPASSLIALRRAGAGSRRRASRSRCRGCALRGEGSCRSGHDAMGITPVVMPPSQD